MRVRKIFEPKDFRSPVSSAVHRQPEGTYWYNTSREEVMHAIDVLGQRVLRHAQDLQGDGSFGGKHWISRIHKSWTPWKLRQRLVRKLAELL